MNAITRFGCTTGGLPVPEALHRVRALGTAPVPTERVPLPVSAKAVIAQESVTQ